MYATGIWRTFCWILLQGSSFCCSNGWLGLFLFCSLGSNPCWLCCSTGEFTIDLFKMFGIFNGFMDYESNESGLFWQVWLWLYLDYAFSHLVTWYMLMGSNESLIIFSFSYFIFRSFIYLFLSCVAAQWITVYSLFILFVLVMPWCSG